MKKLLLLLFLVSLFMNLSSGSFTVGINETYVGTQAASGYEGLIYVPAVNQEIISITKSALTDATNCLLILNSTNSILKNTTFSGDTCTISPAIILTANTAYKIVAHNHGTTAVKAAITYPRSTNFLLGNFTNGCYGFDLCNQGIASSGYQITSITINTGGIMNNTYNLTTYETAREAFTSNFTIQSDVNISSLRLIYASSPYTASSSLISGNFYRFSSSLDIPLRVTTNLWFWSIMYENSSQQNLTINSQDVSLTNFTLCQSSPQNVRFLNISFKNETVAQERVSASISASNFTYYLGSGSVSKTLSFTSSQENFTYSFCFSPPDKQVTVATDIDYTNTYSQQRTFNPGTLTLTNTTTNRTLFLLPNSDGILVTFQVINPAQQPISGALVEISRSGYGNITSGTTGASGTLSVFLNPNFEYTLTISKTGYTTFSVTQSFTSNEFTIQLGTTSSINITDYTKGIRYSIYPKLTELSNSTIYNFNMTINSTYYNLDHFGFTLTNRSGFFLASNISTSSTGGFISAEMNTVHNSSIIMNYFWQINGTPVNYSISWIVTNNAGSEFSLFRFFTDLKSYSSQGMFGLNDFSLAIILFIGVFLFTGILSYKFGLNSPVTIMGLLLSIVLFLDYGLDIIPQGGSSVSHPISLITILIFVIVTLREMSR